MSEKHKKHQKRDSLTELENFIDSYAAEEETDDDEEAEDDEQQRMINLLKQQMMTNLTLMNNLSKQTGIPPARFPIANPAVPNPLLQNMMMPNLMPMAAPNLLANPLANPLLNLQRMQQPPVDPKNLLNMGLNMKLPLINPMFQAQPVLKTEMNNSSPYPTVMIPGVGPCVMIPNDKTSNEKAADDLKRRLESVDGENKVLTRRSSIDTSNFPKEILRDQPRRRSSTKSEDLKDASVIIKSKIKKDKTKESSTRRVITIKESPEPAYTSKERRKSKTSDKKLLPTLDEKKKEKVKGGHQVYVPPLRRGSEDVSEIPPISPPKEMEQAKPIKSILKKRKEPEPEKIKPEKKLDQDKKVQREHKEITSFVTILEKLGTDDSELDNIADLIIKKSIRKHSQVSRLMAECANIIEKKPKFRSTFLQNLQQTHTERKAIRKENRENFLGLVMLLIEVYLTLKTSDGKNLQVLVLPIKESITEMLNDANFNANEARSLCEAMIRLGPVLTTDHPDSLDMIMTTARAVSIHVVKITPEARKYLLKLVELYAHCWEPLDSNTSSFFSSV